MVRDGGEIVGGLFWPVLVEDGDTRELTEG